LSVVLVGVWLLLQGELTVANVLGGVALGLFLTAMFPVSEHVVHHRFHPWAFTKLILFVLYSLVISSWEVIKVILHPTPTSLRSGIVRVRLEAESPLTTTIVANAVTLTPGTMTLTARVDPAELHIHALGLADPEEFRESVLDLERRTGASLTPELDVPKGDAA
jgi:multicomponent Na+:H+ antiporter subunit E